MKGNYFYILIFILIIFVACNSSKKNDSTPNTTPQPILCDTCLPPITTTGTNTFGCRVNGKVWLPKGGSFTPATNADIFGNLIQISGYNTTRSEWVTICLNPIYDTCYYQFPNNTLSKRQGKFLTFKDFIVDTITNGYIHFLRVDYTKGVFSGTFAFDTYSYDKMDTIHITEGRFDIRK